MKQSVVQRALATSAFVQVGEGLKSIGIVVGNCRLLLNLPLYWDELAKLNWWLLWSDEASAMEERVDAEYDKYWTFYELTRFSRRHAELMDAFLSYGLQQSPRPPRPA